MSEENKNNETNNDNNKKGDNRLKFLAMAILAMIFCFMLSGLIDEIFNEPVEPKLLTYNEFIEAVEAGEVDEVHYSASSENMVVYMFNEETKDMTLEERVEHVYDTADSILVPYPANDGFRKYLLEHNVDLIITSTSSIWWSVLSSVLSLLLPFGLVFLLFRPMLSGTSSPKKDQLLQKSKVKFKDVIGHDEILDDVKFIANLIKNPKIGDNIGAKVPSGVLFSGDPGTGKTLIAKAIAGEADVPFLYINGSSLIEMYVGLGAKRVRDIFRIAKKSAPCIVFIDEIDAIGGSRDSKSSTSEHDQTINALLQEMDGFTGREGIFVIAATNRPDKLDPALKRAGRFDRQIVVNKPRDWKVRKKLFEHYLGKFKVSDDVNIDILSKQVSGFTGADIAAICNEASIVAVMHDKDYIDNACIEEAIDKKVFKGNRSKEDHFKDDKRIIAYHEAGHGIMSYLCNEPIARASIIGTTSGVGGVVFNQDTDSLLRTKSFYESKIMICYAGRASEEIKFKDVSIGASNDITQATSILYDYVSKVGFDSDFGLLDIEVLSRNNLLDNSNSFDLIQNKAKELYNKTVKLLADNYDLVEKLANALLELETIDGTDIENLLRG